MKKLFSTVMVIAALLSTAGAFATNHFQTTLYRSTADQTYLGAGVAAPNQATSNYTVLPSSGYTCESAEIGCTYQRIGTQYQFVQQGDNSLN